jgi:predicted nuclease of predicted toxin-antitoxin system
MKFLADENFNNDILRGVWRRIPEASITRVQDTEIAGAPDQRVLEYAAQQGYIVLSHDVNTLRGYFYERVEAEQPVPGVFLVHKVR